MNWIDLGNPVPHPISQRYQSYDWPSSEIEILEPLSKNCLPSLEILIENRRTKRTFLSLQQEAISSFLWLSCRIIDWGSDYLGFPITRRPTPSAGGIHPIHVLLLNNAGDWRRYDPAQHALAKVEINKETHSALWADIEKLVDPQNGTVITFVAEPGMTFAKYQNGDSLVWRDTGVLLGHMSLVAEALSLNFCPLGITGEPWISSLDKNHRLFGAGVALLGSR